MYVKLDSAKIFGSLVTMALNGADHGVFDLKFLDTPPTTVVFADGDPYSETSLCSTATSTELEPRVVSWGVKMMDEPPETTDKKEVEKHFEEVAKFEAKLKGHRTSVAIVRLMGTVYIHTVVEVSEKVGEKPGHLSKVEINGLGGVKNASIKKETEERDGTTTVVDKNAETVCPDGKFAAKILALNGTNKFEESTKRTADGKVVTHYVDESEK